ncbi:hypothetical protein PRECH8_18890 [Insulibacter thermoxylanivorax]|uniref:Uncharacterized protein n=1 Tax=Insulibacter thermoxylanivorax TaxID=2749268 RepID=A0A916QFQ3_9BACL|nr:hypothetical protein [Insulibacter thermoxylanivorax]GFR38593.1 hypothetical protein PRECH8_18890 [Insulibacter thermoxylanivorax]
MSAKKNKASKGAGRAAANEGSINIVQNRYIDGSFRDNEPVIRDDADEWLVHLNSYEEKT